ncbi:MAG: hypothetical protein ABIS47_08930 [Acidimicrobiales bacterium]
MGELSGEAATGRVRAAGTCVDVRHDPELGLAMRADLEDAAGDARVVLLGYRKRFPRRVVIAPSPVERPGVVRLFASEM